MALPRVKQPLFVVSADRFLCINFNVGFTRDDTTAYRFEDSTRSIYRIISA